MRKNQAIMTVFPSVSAAFCLESLYFVPCRQAATSAYCCSAVSRSLIAKPPPFLGVSSLNLAALRSGHFFCLGLLASGFVAPALVDELVSWRRCGSQKVRQSGAGRCW